MNNLSRFQKEELELIINTKTGECFASQGMTARMCKATSRQISTYMRGEADSIKTLPVEDSRGVTQNTKLYPEKLIKKCLRKYNPDLLDECLDVGLRVRLHQLAGYEVISTAIERETRWIEEREKIERKFLPTPDLKEIDYSATMFGKRFGRAYEQRYLLQQVDKHHPALLGEAPRPEEKESLSTAHAFFTPTQIAEQLNWNYKTGNPNPQAVNKKLQELGYQEKIGKQWSATEKAISANLCDLAEIRFAGRKPVETNSRTQKDQLLWSTKIIDILGEFSPAQK